MIKPLYILLTIGFMIAMASCTNEIIDGKIKTDTIENAKGYGSTSSYTYDSKGRMIKSRSGVTDTIEMEYDYSHPDTLLSFNSFPGTPYPNKDTLIWLLDTHGHAIRQGFSQDTYSDDGFLIKEVLHIGVTTTYEVSNGDIISRRSIYDNGDTIAELFTYYPTPDYRTYGQPYNGKTSLHICKTQTNIDENHRRSEYRYEYVFDKKGRVIKETHYGPKGLDGTYSYTYAD